LSQKVSDWFVDQRINIKFCVKLWTNANDTFVMLSGAYGGEDIKQSSVFEWYKWFKESSHIEITNGDSVILYKGYFSL